MKVEIINLSDHYPFLKELGSTATVTVYVQDYFYEIYEPFFQIIKQIRLRSLYYPSCLILNKSIKLHGRKIKSIPPCIKIPEELHL